jgi:hypothetical protein
VRKFAFWPIAAIIVGAISWFYHPSFELALGGTGIGLALTGLIIWSSSKLLDSKWWLARVAMVSMVAGLMNATALDVLYSLLAAPAGGRFQIGIETILGGLVLTLLAFIWTFFRPQKEENRSSGNSER